MIFSCKKNVQCLSHDALHLKYQQRPSHDLLLQTNVQCFSHEILQLKYLQRSSHDLLLQKCVQWLLMIKSCKNKNSLMVPAIACSSDCNTHMRQRFIFQRLPMNTRVCDRNAKTTLQDTQKGAGWVGFT